MGSKYPILKPREIIKAIESLGFVLTGQKGSHAKYSNGIKTIIIPMHDEVARYTLKAILEQGDLPLEDFLKLL